MANGANGVLISDTAHDNMIGGYLRVRDPPEHLLRQHRATVLRSPGPPTTTRSFNSGIGTNSLLLTGLGNNAGGVLLSSSGSNNLIGGFSTDPLQPRTNYIDGNLGNGVTLSAGVTGDQIVGNFIGLDRLGFAVPNTGQPIAINGSFGNYIVGNTTGAAQIVDRPARPGSDAADRSALRQLLWPRRRSRRHELLDVPGFGPDGRRDLDRSSRPECFGTVRSVAGKHTLFGAHDGNP